MYIFHDMIWSKYKEYKVFRNKSIPIFAVVLNICRLTKTNHIFSFATEAKRNIWIDFTFQKIS